MSLKDNLKTLRERAGYASAKDFASLLGIQYTSYMSYENKGSWPNEENLCRIASALGCTPNDLIGFMPTGEEAFVYYADMVESVESVCLIEVIPLEDGRVFVKAGSPGLSCTFPDKESFVRRFRNAMDNMKKYSLKYKIALDDAIVTVLESCHNKEQATTNIINHTIESLQQSISQATNTEERGKLKQALQNALSELESSE